MDCGQTFRIVSAERMLKGKRTSRVMAECCGGRTVFYLHKDERYVLIRRHQIKLVKSS